MNRMRSNRRCLAAAAALAAVLTLAGGQASAQQKNQTAAPNAGPPNALQGFSQNRNMPVKIQAANLELREKDQKATFSGDVHVVQGDTEMRSKSLVVFYDSEGKSGMKAAQPGPSGQQQIRRIEAIGGVVVTQKDQNASGDTGIFDMRSNTVTLTGNVVVTRGKDVLRGHRLVVNMATGVSRMESSSGQPRVEGLFQQAPRPETPPAQSQPAQPRAN
jgi:lipopolysaccharide export system protein LptA